MGWEGMEQWGQFWGLQQQESWDCLQDPAISATHSSDNLCAPIMYISITQGRESSWLSLGQTVQ